MLGLLFPLRRPEVFESESGEVTITLSRPVFRRDRFYWMLEARGMVRTGRGASEFMATARTMAAMFRDSGPYAELVRLACDVEDAVRGFA